ncbi:MAG: methyltransferase domain-containing protein [Candidatus Thorarchaeota archaeon]
MKAINNEYAKFVEVTGQTIHSKRYCKVLEDEESRKVYEFAFKYLKGMNVIDIGCFVGFYSCLMAQYANSVLGIDTNGKAIGQAGVLKRLVGCSNVKFRIMSGHNVTPSFLEENDIKAMFLHKVISASSGWSNELQSRLWEIVKEKIDVLIASATNLDSQKLDILRPIFREDARFEILEVGHHLVVIKRI